MYDDKIKYYNLYTFTTTKDARGEVSRSFVFNKQIRGFFVFIGEIRFSYDIFNLKVFFRTIVKEQVF